MPDPRPRMLAVVRRFAWFHINYLKSLDEHFDVRVAWSGEGGRGAAEDGVHEGLWASPIGAVRDVGASEVRSRLKAILDEWQPDVVHLTYYDHDDLTLLVRDLAGDEVTVVYESWNSQVVRSGAERGSEAWTRERDALTASDAQIFVAVALRAYLERAHGLDLGATSLIVPQGFARHTIAPPSPKLSADDGRVHMALVGTASDQPDQDRWYVEIIRRLVSQGLVVHSHFFEPPAFDMGDLSLDAYHDLARELDDYHFHPAVRHREGRLLSELVSGYDLMGVFYGSGPLHGPEIDDRAVSLPSKAVCGWLHGGIPAVCFPHCRGVVEWIEELGIGFVIDRWEDLGPIASDRTAIAAATERCLAIRDRFTNEHNAARIRKFLDPLLERKASKG